MDKKESNQSTSQSFGCSSFRDSIGHHLRSFLLNEKIYLPWSRAATIVLGGKGKLAHISKEDQPAKTDVTYEAWQTSDKEVMTLVFFHGV